jgi:peptide/nickel transport system substrate-binding protein
VTHHWFRKPKLAVPILLLLALAMACGTSVQPTEAPQPTAPPAMEQSTQAPAPTAMAEPVSPPGDSGGPEPGVEYAPAFAEYWQPPTAVYGEPVKGGTLRIIYEDPLEHANVWGAPTGATDRYRSPTMNLLVQENPYDSSGEFIPDLAQSWTIHEDNQGVTFNFHDGIKWHNGAEFTCEDARFSLQVMATGEGITSSYMKGRLPHLDVPALKCDDDQTLNMRFKAPTSVPLLVFTNRRAVIFNKAWFEAGGEEAMFRDASVGTGAFRWAPGQEVGFDTQHFERNPDYFFSDGVLPYVDNVTVVGIVDESAQQAAMLAHQGDWHWVRNWGQYQAYVDHDQIQTVIRTTRGHFQIWMNIRNEPFDNVRVRQAIAMGIDQRAGIAVLQDGHASTGFLMPPGSKWELDQAQGCAVPGWCVADDMEAQRAEAKKILEEEGFDFNKTYLFTVESDNQVVARATFVQEQLRLLGIQTDFDLVETVAYRHQEQNGLWGDFLPRNATMAADDPSAGLGSYLRCDSIENRWSPGTPCDEKLEGLLDQVDGTTDPVERKAISDEIQLHAMQQYMYFPLYWEQEAAAFWPEVRGYAHFPTPYGSWLKFQSMWIDPAHKDDKGFSGQTTGLPGGL